MSEELYTDEYEIPEAERLRLLIDDEIIKGRRYSLLAEACRAGAREAFEAMRALTQASIAELETEFLLLTGDSYPGTKTSVCLDGVFGGMRDAYMCEQLSEKKLLLASESASYELSKVYLEAASRSQSNADALKHILTKAMQ